MTLQTTLAIIVKKKKDHRVFAFRSEEERKTNIERFPPKKAECWRIQLDSSVRELPGNRAAEAPESSIDTRSMTLPFIPVRADSFVREPSK